MQRYNGKQLYEDDFHLQEQVINPHILAPSLIYSYTVNMEAKECISQKISQIKSVAYNKIKNGELETIPYTNILLDGKQSIKFDHMPPIDNMIFHFTRSSNFKYIFDDNTLLLNRSENMSDPIENKWYFKNSDTGESVNALMRHNVRFTCFCKPFLTIENNIIPAYALSRMWNQYGGNYDGCCIGFNKEKLIKLFENQYPTSNRIGEIKYDLPLDPAFGTSPTYNISTTQSTLKIYEDGSGVYKLWDDSMAKDLYLSTDMFGFLFRKSFDYRDENEIRFSIYDPSEEPKFIKGIDSAIEIIIFGYKVSDEQVFEYDTKTKATIYRLYFESPYRLVNNTINQHLTKGYGRIEKITTPETDFLKKYNSIINKYPDMDIYSDKTKIEFLNLYDRIKQPNSRITIIRTKSDS